jgi:hypothetical protein
VLLVFNQDLQLAAYDQEQFDFPVIVPVDEQIVDAVRTENSERQQRIFIFDFFVVSLHALTPAFAKSHSVQTFYLPINFILSGVENKNQ